MANPRPELPSPIVGPSLQPRTRSSMARTESPLVRRVLIGTALVFVGVMLLAPLAIVFSQALSKGIAVYTAAIVDPAALSALKLTFLAAAIAVPLNLVFGI